MYNDKTNELLHMKLYQFSEYITLRLIKGTEISLFFNKKYDNPMIYFTPKIVNNVTLLLETIHNYKLKQGLYLNKYHYSNIPVSYKIGNLKYYLKIGNIDIIETNDIIYLANYIIDNQIKVETYNAWDFTKFLRSIMACDFIIIRAYRDVNKNELLLATILPYIPIMKNKFALFITHPLSFTILTDPEIGSKYGVGFILRYHAKNKYNVSFNLYVKSIDIHVQGQSSKTFTSWIILAHKFTLSELEKYTIKLDELENLDRCYLCNETSNPLFLELCIRNIVTKGKCLFNQKVWE